MDERCSNNGFADDRYKYTEKERDVETGYDYFGARYYDARVGRWMSVDPLAEKYPAWSPYVYSMSSPIVRFDPDGKEVRAFTEWVTTNGSNASVLAQITLSRHSFVYVSTPKGAWTLEIAGPINSTATPKITEVSKDFDGSEANGRTWVSEASVKRPDGVGPDDYTFGNGILQLFEIMKDNLPVYNGLGPNSNGFARFLVEQAGGSVDLPWFAYYSSPTAYQTIYQQYVTEHLAEEVAELALTIALSAM